MRRASSRPRGLLHSLGGMAMADPAAARARDLVTWFRYGAMLRASER
jgi:hypothetical protein